jgi:hypothetical protein
MVSTFPTPNGWILNSVIDYSDAPMQICGRLVDGMAILYHLVGEETPVEIIVRPRPTRLPQPDNVKRIYQELIKLIDVPLPAYGNERVMYVGMPQSGKSLVQFILLWTSCFVHEKGTVHLLMNRIDSLLQNISRDYFDLCKTIKNICERLDIPDYQNYMFDYVPFPTYAAVETEADSIYTVYVAMANKKQLTKVKEMPVTNRQTLVFDEADVFVQPSRKTVMKLIEGICLECERRYECTATPFSNFNEAGQVYDMVITMPPRSEYRGYDSDKIHRHIVSDDTIEKKLNGILKKLFKKDTGSYRNITLVNVDSKIGEQERVAETIRLKFGTLVEVDVMNSRSVYKKPLTMYMNQKANSGDMRPLVLVTGLMASRAVTFRTSKENPKQAILTAMVYMPSKMAHQTTLMQAQRIYGNYDESCPVIDVYLTREVNDAIRNSFVNNSSITARVTPMNESRECIKRAPVTFIPHRKFSATDDSDTEKIENTEFSSLGELVRFVTNKFNKYRFRDIVETSESLVQVPIPENGTRKEIRAAIRDYVGAHGQRMHVAWREARYQELFSAKLRIKNERYTVVKYACGDGNVTGNYVKCIKWKDGYEDVNTWNDPDVIYVFRTTKETWKFWLPAQMDRFRKIEH